MKRSISDEGFRRISRKLEAVAMNDSEVWDKLDLIRTTALSDTELVEEILLAMNTKQAHEILDSILKMMGVRSEEDFEE